MERLYPDFSSMNETVTSNPKWQDKVEALGKLEQFIQTNASLFAKSQDAVIQYVMVFSKDFKAANINILKSAFSIAKTTISCCNAGFRACQPVIIGAISKIHDKKLNAELAELLSTIAEKIGPNKIVTQVIPDLSAITLRFRSIWEVARFQPSRRQSFSTFKH